MVLTCNSDAEATDTANNLLRENQRDYHEFSALVDYKVHSAIDTIRCNVSTYQEGDAFQNGVNDASH